MISRETQRQVERAFMIRRFNTGPNPYNKEAARFYREGWWRARVVEKMIFFFDRHGWRYVSDRLDAFYVNHYMGSRW